MTERSGKNLDRVADYKKNATADATLSAMNEALASLEDRLIADFDTPRYPVIFVVGVQRSGTTLLSQVVAAGSRVGYFSNLLARFWRAPFIGSALCVSLGTYEEPNPAPFRSDLGYTRGVGGPHEAGYFWNRWFPVGEVHELPMRQLENVNVSHLRKELAALESNLELPLMFKNLINCSLQIRFLSQCLPTSVFVYCRRDPVYIAQSTLESRLKFYGTKDAWWGLRPAEYTWLKNKPCLEQVAGQACFGQQAIVDSLHHVAPHRTLVIDYKSLCADPEAQMERLHTLLHDNKFKLQRTNAVLESFKHSDERRLSDAEFTELTALCRQYTQRIESRR